MNTNDLSQEWSGDEAFKDALTCVHNNFKMSKLWQNWRPHSMMTCRLVCTCESVLYVSSRSRVGTWIWTFETSAAMYQSIEDRVTLCAKCWQSQFCRKMHLTACHRTTEGVAVESYDICIRQTVVQFGSTSVACFGRRGRRLFCIFLSNSLRFHSDTKFRQSCCKCCWINQAETWLEFRLGRTLNSTRLPPSKSLFPRCIWQSLHQIRRHNHTIFKNRRI